MSVMCRIADVIQQQIKLLRFQMDGGKINQRFLQCFKYEGPSGPKLLNKSIEDFIHDTIIHFRLNLKQSVSVGRIWTPSHL